MFFAEIFDQPTGFSQVYTDPGPISLPGGMVTFPLMGVAFGQVLRFTAVAVNPGAGPCNGQLGFEDMDGMARPPNPNLTLMPGHGAFVDFPSPATQFGRRALIRPTIMVSSDSTSAMPCMGVQSSAEIFDVFSGHTWSEISGGPQQ